MKKFLLLIILVVAAMTVSGCGGRDASFGYVDIQKILEGSAKFKELNEQMEKKVTEVQTLDVAEQNTLPAEDYAKNAQMRRNELVALQKDLENQLKTTLDNAMEAVANEKKLGAILVKGGVLHGGVDVTDDVLKRMN